jgi:hypothetical protein
MNRSILLLALLLRALGNFAQPENNIWVFGLNCGLDVGSPQPAPFLGAVINTLGGTASAMAMDSCSSTHRGSKCGIVTSN